MGRHAAPWVLIALLMILHGQLWFGRGSVSAVFHLRTELSEQLKQIERIKVQNKRLETEINDLQGGLDMVEEKARMELGMIKPNEIYVQIAR